MNVRKIARRVENNVDPDQTPHFAKTWLYVKYGNLIKSNHILDRTLLPEVVFSLDFDFLKDHIILCIFF